MAYVRRKQVKGRTYYQFVESYRDNGRVRQRVIAHLGPWPSVEEAIDGWSTRAELWSRRARQLRESIGATEEQRQAYYERLKDRRLQIPHWTDRPRNTVRADTRSTLDRAIGYERSAEEATRKVRELQAIASAEETPPGYNGEPPEYEIDIKVGRTAGGYLRCLSGFNRYTASMHWEEE